MKTHMYHPTWPKPKRAQAYRGRKHYGDSPEGGGQLTIPTLHPDLRQQHPHSGYGYISLSAFTVLPCAKPLEREELNYGSVTMELATINNPPLQPPFVSKLTQ